MQIIKLSTIKAGVVGNDPPTNPTAPASPPDPQIQNNVSGFFGQDSSTEEAASQSNPFDLLFSGAPVAPGTNINGNGPSTDQFAPAQVVTLQDWLIAHPEGRFFLDKFITKMESVRDKRFVKRADQLEQALAKGGMTARETAVVQSQIDEIKQGIAKINEEIGKTKAMQESQKANYQQELIHQADLNGDGYVGDPNDKNNSFIVAHPPNDPSKIVLLDPNTMKPATDPVMDPQYMPALATTGDGGNLKLLDPPDGPNNNFNEALQLNGDNVTNGHPGSTFGAQIDISAPEGFWVAVDPTTHKPVIEQDDHGRASRYKTKKLELIDRVNSDGTKTKMIGQNPPTEEEKGQYTFIKVTDLSIFSQPMEGVDGGYVFYNFKDRTGNIVESIRIQGVNDNNQTGLRSGDSHYIAATSVGIAVNAGAGDHSSRARPLNVDASNFVSTGRVLPANPFDPAQIDNFYKQLGIDGHHNADGTFTGADPSGGRNVSEGEKAANSTLMDSFLSARSGPSFLFLGTSPIMGKQFGYTKTKDGKGHISTMAAYLPKDKIWDDYKSGLFCTGIRGVIKGTKYNDIIVVPEPDEKKIKDLLPIGATDIKTDSPAYGTVVEAGAGHNIIVSKGGDIFASGASFFWRESSQEGEKIVLKTNNGKSANQKIFSHIGDTNAAAVEIDNGDDSSLEDAAKNPGHEAGVPDDWYEGPANTGFTVLQNDIPGDENIVTSNVDVINKEIADARTNITNDIIHLNPLSTAGSGDPQWVYGKQFEEWQKTADSFFSEWNFYNGTDGADDGIPVK